MTTSTFIGRIASGLLLVGPVVAATNSLAAAGEPGLKDQANAGQSPTVVLESVSPIKSASVNTLNTVSDWLTRVVGNRRLVEQTRRAETAIDSGAAEAPCLKWTLNDVRRCFKRWGKVAGDEPQQVIPEETPTRPSTAKVISPTSRLMWPEILYREYYVSHRADIEKLMAERVAGDSGEGMQNQEQIQLAVARMKSKLKEKVNTTSPMDYLGAKKFLDNLAFEARFVVGPSTQMFASR